MLLKDKVIRKKYIVKKGIIKTDLSNIKESKIKGTKSTGHLYGEIRTKNMYIIPGTTSIDKLLKKLNNGIYITD